MMCIFAMLQVRIDLSWNELYKFVEIFNLNNANYK